MRDSLFCAILNEVYEEGWRQAAVCFAIAHRLYTRSDHKYPCEIKYDRMMG